MHKTGWCPEWACPKKHTDRSPVSCSPPRCAANFWIRKLSTFHKVH